jgi:hypothetical protein
MARKAECGIEYFPMNSDIIHNPKIRLLVAEFGSKTTWTVLLTLYCKIYREKGYWIDWFDEDSKLLFAQDECKLELSVVNEFVNGCVRRSLFNKGVFDMFGVLTSDRIQENYLIAKKRNKEVSFIDDFLLLNDDVYKTFTNVTLRGLDVDIIKKKVNISTQKKKENKKLEGEGDCGEPPVTHTEDQLEMFKTFNSYITKHAPNVGKMKEPFTIEQYFKLKDAFKSDFVSDVLGKMHNWKPLNTKNVSAYQTFLNWSKKDYGKSEPATTSGPSPSELKAAKLLTEINGIN